MASDGDWFWPLAGAALLAWFAYDKWWKAPDAPPHPPLPIPSPSDPYPEGPLATLNDGTVWRMVWSKVHGPRDKRLAWVRADYSKNAKVKAREQLTLFTINCETSGYRTLSVVAYNKDGEVLNSWNESVFGKEYSYAPPGSNIDAVVEAACLSRFDPPAPVTTNQPKP